MQRFFFSFLVSLILCLLLNGLPADHLRINAEESHEVSNQQSIVDQALKQNPTKLVQQALTDYALGNYERMYEKYK